jgi:hypothetical protein
MDETTSEYGARLAQSIQEMANQIVTAEAGAKFPEAENFHRESVQALNKIIMTVRRYVPKLHRGLKTETAALNSALVRLENSIKALGTALDESPGAKIESVGKDADALARRHNELLALRKEEDEKATTLASISAQEDAVLTEEQELTSHGEFLELKRYDESSRSKQDEIRQLVQPIVKPLLKLERAASADRDSRIDLGTLHRLVEDPVQTVATGQSFSVSELLDRLDEALRRGQLDIEERKRRKAEETIQLVKNGAIGRFRDEYLAIQANVQETMRRLRSNGLLEKKDRLEEHLAQIRSEKDALAARHKDLRRRIDDGNKELLKQKTALEFHIAKLAHRPVSILAG